MTKKLRNFPGVYPSLKLKSSVFYQVLESFLFAKKSLALGACSEAELGTKERAALARMFHEWLAATLDMAVLPGVLGCRLLRRNVQVRLGTYTLRLPEARPSS
jgi:hypothetical protein